MIHASIRGTQNPYGQKPQAMVDQVPAYCACKKKKKKKGKEK